MNDLHCHDRVVTDSVRMNRNPRERVRRTGQAYCVSLKKNFDKEALVLSLYPKLESPERFIF